MKTMRVLWVIFEMHPQIYICSERIQQTELVANIQT